MVRSRFCFETRIAKLLNHAYSLFEPLPFKQYPEVPPPQQPLLRVSCKLNRGICYFDVTGTR